MFRLSNEEMNDCEWLVTCLVNFCCIDTIPLSSAKVSHCLPIHSQVHWCHAHKQQY